VSALAIQHAHENGSKLQPATTSASTSQTPDGGSININTSQPATTPAQPTLAQPTPSTVKSSETASLSTLPDQYGCPQNTPGYDSCVKYAKQNALTLSCGSQAKTASDTYYPLTLKAQAAYDTVMAEWNAVKDQPYQTHNPYTEYAADAKTKYTAIEKPAYATYVSTINSLNTNGCNEILAYSDTSWAGY
jgi:hypothetical protein